MWQHFLLILQCSLFTLAASPRVKVAQGTLEGEEVALVTGKGSYYSFKGIPYAEAPVGELRFKAPHPPKSWTGVRSASQHGNECYQFNIFSNSVLVNGSEDCLFLNVYTPPNLKPKAQYPVIVFIHGGGFTSGSGNQGAYSPDFLIPHDVILVTFNYRLEVFGFLSLENDQVPGNNGLKDQVAALRWIQNNIASFGGNRFEVTLFGQSAGSASVGLHILSPMSAGLFHRAIMHSGSPFNDWALTNYPRDRAFIMGEGVGINTTSETELLKKLKSLPKEELISKSANLLAWDGTVILTKNCYFCPVVEKKYGKEEAFLFKSPEEYLFSGEYNDVELIIGYVSAEGIANYGQFKAKYDIMNQQPHFFLSKRMAYELAPTQGIVVGKKIKNYFVNDTIVSEEVVPELIKYFSWSSFQYGVQKFIELISCTKKKPMYQYYFSAETERNYYKNIYGPSYHVDGVCHLDDMPYIFHIPTANITIDQTANGFKIVSQITKIWTTFAKTGKPTLDSGSAWKEWTLESQQYLEIGSTDMALKKNLNAELYEFWDAIEGPLINN